MVVKVNPNLNQSSEFKEEKPCEKLPKYKEKEKKKHLYTFSDGIVVSR